MGFIRLFSRREHGAPAYLIAGLGNPGQKYARTRHNVGFMAADYLAAKLDARVWRGKFGALTAMAELDGARVLIIKPQTYMNLSGGALRQAANFYKIPTERIVVLFDDVSLPCGALRIRAKGSDGGHNGIKSIIAQLGTDCFPRVKIGVGDRPSPEIDLADWVLGDIPKAQQQPLEQALEKCAAACALIVHGRLAEAQNAYNG